MKKIILLFTILSAGALYSMEPEKKILGGTWENLPKEIKSLIITAITPSGDNADEAIKNIIRMSQVNKELNAMINANDLEGFTKIINMLADKFSQCNTLIAYKFKTPIVNLYFNLFRELSYAISKQDIQSAENLLEQGADTNSMLSLILTVGKPTRSAKMIKLLLDHGANPHRKTSCGQTALDTLNQYPNFPEYEEIKQLLEEAMKK